MDMKGDSGSLDYGSCVSGALANNQTVTETFRRFSRPSLLFHRRRPAKQVQMRGVLKTGVLSGPWRYVRIKGPRLRFRAIV